MQHICNKNETLTQFEIVTQPFAIHYSAPSQPNTREKPNREKPYEKKPQHFFMPTEKSPYTLSSNHVETIQLMFKMWKKNPKLVS